jgi:hypothetical protein
MDKQTVLAAVLLALGAGNAWSQSQAAGGGQLEKCNETLGTLAWLRIATPAGIAKCSSIKFSPLFRCCAC